jgi:Holliday junction resolvase RusA-like endonuclease
VRIAFSVAIDGRGKGRPKFTSRGGFARAYTDAKTRTYEATIKEAGKAAMAMAGLEPLHGAVVLKVRVRRPILKSANKTQKALMLLDRIRPVSKPDWDNYGKAVCDALNGVAYHDDAQIVHGTVTKIYAEAPGIDIVIEPWKPSETVNPLAERPDGTGLEP